MKLFAISFFAVVLASTGSFIPLNEELFIDWTERATAVKANIGAGVVLANTTYLNCTADANCTKVESACKCADVTKDAKSTGQKICFNQALGTNLTAKCAKLNGTEAVTCSQTALNDSVSVCVAPSSQKNGTNTGTAAPCVSTAWLKKYGLEHETISSSGYAKVMCIPGLPCGTYGHLLRKCKKTDSECDLVTYEKACEQRLDCIESETMVSQLSHAFDWGQFASIDGSLSLTSLSAHPGAAKHSFSFIIAQMADWLNYNGLGRVTNLVARLARIHERGLRLETESM